MKLLENPFFYALGLLLCFLLVFYVASKDKCSPDPSMKKPAPKSR